MSNTYPHRENSEKEKLYDVFISYRRDRDEGVGMYLYAVKDGEAVWENS